MIVRRLQAGNQAALVGILSEEGLHTLRRKGHAAAAAGCAPDLPAPRVRFVDASMWEFLESASDAEVAALYGAPFPAGPLVAATAPAERGVTLDVRIQPDLACLRGHFPDLPVVPGAVLLGWAIAFGSEMLGTPPTMRGLRTVKFERIVQPGRELRLHLRAEPGGDLRFEYASASGRHSAGCIETGRGDA